MRISVKRSSMPPAVISGPDWSVISHVPLAFTEMSQREIITIAKAWCHDSVLNDYEYLCDKHLVLLLSRTPAPNLKNSSGPCFLPSSRLASRSRLIVMYSIKLLSAGRCSSDFYHDPYTAHISRARTFADSSCGTPAKAAM